MNVRLFRLQSSLTIQVCSQSLHLPHLDERTSYHSSLFPFLITIRSITPGTAAVPNLQRLIPLPLHKHFHHYCCTFSNSHRPTSRLYPPTQPLCRDDSSGRWPVTLIVALANDVYSPIKSRQRRFSLGPTCRTVRVLARPQKLTKCRGCRKFSPTSAKRLSEHHTQFIQWKQMLT